MVEMYEQAIANRPFVLFSINKNYAIFMFSIDLFFFVFSYALCCLCLDVAFF